MKGVPMIKVVKIEIIDRIMTSSQDRKSLS